MMPSMENGREKRRLWNLSTLHVGWLLFWYLAFFLVLRLGIGHMNSFRHPLPTTTAAWFALPAALIVWFLVNVKDG
jgi:hypothetical protein